MTEVRLAGLDERAGDRPIAAEERAEVEDPESRRACHQRRLAEPGPPPKRPSVREGWGALWAAPGLPPRPGHPARDVAYAGRAGGINSCNGAGSPGGG